MFEYEETIKNYVQALEELVAKYELPDTWFRAPDHLAITCADGLDYEYILQDLLPDAQHASEVNMDGRRLAALCLISPQPVGSFGKLSWLEVMEPRPEKLDNDLVGLEHMEFYYPDFSEICEVLQVNAIAYTQQSNPGHQWINIVINDQGQELKLNNRALAEIVSQELGEGIAHLL